MNSNICRKKTFLNGAHLFRKYVRCQFVFWASFKTFNPITKLIHNMNHNNIKDMARWFIKSFLLTLNYPKFHNVRRMLLTCKGWNVKIINIYNKNNPKKSLYTAPLVNSIKLGFNFPCVEAFLFKKKNLFKKKLNFLHISLCIIFLIKSFVEKNMYKCMKLSLFP